MFCLSVRRNLRQTRRGLVSGAVSGRCVGLQVHINTFPECMPSSNCLARDFVQVARKRDLNDLFVVMSRVCKVHRSTGVLVARCCAEPQ